MAWTGSGMRSAISRWAGPGSECRRWAVVAGLKVQRGSIVADGQIGKAHAGFRCDGKAVNLWPICRFNLCIAGLYCGGEMPFFWCYFGMQAVAQLIDATVSTPAVGR